MKQSKKSPARRSDDERWSRDIATLRQAAEDLAQRRHKPQNTPFDHIAALLDDPSPSVREKAVRDLYELNPDQAATLVNDALNLPPGGGSAGSAAPAGSGAAPAGSGAAPAGSATK